MRHNHRLQLSATAFFIGLSMVFGYVLFLDEIGLNSQAAWQRQILVVGAPVLWLILAVVFVAILTEKVVLTEWGIHRRSLLRWKEARWSDIMAVSVADRGRAVVLLLMDGSEIKVSLFLNGLPCLWDALEKQLGYQMERVLELYEEL